MCNWGASEAKLVAIFATPSSSSNKLRDHLHDKVRIRLSPMGALKAYDAALDGTTKRSVSIGKGHENDVVVNDELVSRSHCLLEFHKGSVYVCDVSTNGTFINGKRIPKKEGAKNKIMIAHGDELLLKDPNRGDNEFGYIVNLTQVY